VAIPSAAGASGGLEGFVLGGFSSSTSRSLGTAGDFVAPTAASASTALSALIMSVSFAGRLSAGGADDGLAGGIIGSDARSAAAPIGRPAIAAAIIASLASGIPAMVAARWGERLRSGGGAVEPLSRGVDGVFLGGSGGSVGFDLEGGPSHSSPTEPSTSISSVGATRFGSSATAGIVAETGLAGSTFDTFEFVGFTRQIGLGLSERLPRLGRCACWGSGLIDRSGIDWNARCGSDGFRSKGGGSGQGLSDQASGAEDPRIRGTAAGGTVGFCETGTDVGAPVWGAGAGLVEASVRRAFGRVCPSDSNCRKPPLTSAVGGFGEGGGGAFGASCEPERRFRGGGVGEVAFPVGGEDGDVAAARGAPACGGGGGAAEVRFGGSVPRRSRALSPTCATRSITRAIISRRASGCGGIADQRIVTFRSRRASMSTAFVSAVLGFFVSRVIRSSRTFSSCDELDS
jgi:hypothetical protein